MIDILELVGKTFVSVRQGGDDGIIFESSETSTQRNYILEHRQDCCESVYVEDIIGNLSDLENTPILRAEENSSDDISENLGRLSDSDESYTWTFYRFSTIKGTVVIRFYGTSNGYYSETVELYYY